MNKGDKIVDIRDNSIHIVECVDVYDTVTLVFTEGKKYIPLESVKIVPKVLNQIREKIIGMVKPVNKKILTAKEWEQKFGY